MRVICTAGHVDHGKSALVEALTGMQPDRFAEERRRGLTIDLGFAWAELTGASGSGHTVAFVDLPGHERFIANMLAGAGTTDLALFVVAADEGWKAQSQEHLDILTLLGFTRAVVAVTKADTVDPETLELACELTREELADSALAGADVVAVSARTGAGVDLLVERLCALLDGLPPPPDHGRPRLWVDRSFSVRGAGTVVTGTLAGGRLRLGDELVVLPAARRARVRGLQTLKAPVAEAGPGNRVAVNLSGAGREEVVRGDCLTLAGQWPASAALDACLQPLPGRQVDRRGAWSLHAGSAQRSARVLPLSGRPLPDAGGFARVDLDRALALTAGDRFVLRESGRQATVAGGVVLDPAPPPRPRGRAARAARADALDARRQALVAGDRGRLVALHVDERGAADAQATAAATGLTLPRALAGARRHGLAELGPAWAHPHAVASWAAAVVAALEEHHRAQPLQRGAPRDVAERAAARAGCPAGLVPGLLDELLARGAIAAEGPRLRVPGHAVTLDSGQQAARDTLLAALRGSLFAPPGLSAAARAAGASRELVRELEAAGELLVLGPDLAVAPEALDKAARRLRAAYANEGPLSAARARDVLGTSRKYVLPLLEALDRCGRTRRDGDLRHVLG